MLKGRKAQGRGPIEMCGWEEQSFKGQPTSGLGHDGIPALLILFCHILLCVSNVIRGGFFDPLEFRIRQQAFNFGRGSHDQALRGDVDSLGDQGSSANDTVFFDHNPVHDDGSHANQHSIMNRASMEDRMMAHGDVIAKGEGVGIMRDVQQAEVLNIGPMANADTIDVSAYDGMKPDARFRSDDHIADDHGGVFNKRAGGDGWGNASICFEHESGPFAE
jgi:hypothetical protein